MKKILILALVIFAAASAPSKAIQPVATPDVAGNLPTAAGIYDVPGKPELKLRVFVHGDSGKPEVLPGKPTQQQGKPGGTIPSHVCASTVTADQDSGAVVHEAGWKLPATWVYRLNPGSVPSTVGSANLVTISQSGFSRWSSAINQAVTIQRGSDTTANKAISDGQNIIAWGTTSGTALATSYVWYFPSTGTVAEVDTIMNQKFKWYWSDPSTWPAGQTCAFSGVYDAQNILTHELGHTMGLDDEYEASYVNNTMFGYGSLGESKKNTLTTGDIAGAGALY